MSLESADIFQEDCQIWMETPSLKNFSLTFSDNNRKAIYYSRGHGYAITDGFIKEGVYSW